MPLLADYDCLLGTDFLECRRDIRPYLPPWTEGLSFQNPGSGRGSQDLGSSRAPSIGLLDGMAFVDLDPGPDPDPVQNSSGLSDDDAGEDGEVVEIGSTCAGSGSEHSQRPRSTPPEVTTAEVETMRSLLDQAADVEATVLEAWLLTQLGNNDPILNS